MAAPPVRLTVFETAVTSALSGVLSSAAVYPLDTVKTRLQAHPDEDEDETHPPGRLRQFFRDRLPLVYGILVHVRHGEIGALFKGFGTNMWTTFFMRACTPLSPSVAQATDPLLSSVVQSSAIFTGTRFCAPTMYAES